MSIKPRFPAGACRSRPPVKSGFDLGGNVLAGSPADFSST
jgi:hypothetical protein